MWTMIGVWVKRDGEWKVLVGHESTLEESWQAVLDQGGIEG